MVVVDMEKTALGRDREVKQRRHHKASANPTGDSEVCITTNDS